MNTSLAEDIYISSFNLGLKPNPDISVSEWADRFRVLPKKSATEPGPWRTSRTPYLKEIMDCLTPSNPIEQIKVIKGTQLGFTEAGNNWFGYIVHYSPAPMMMLFPTLDNAKRHSKLKIAPTIEATPALRERIREPRARDSGNTTYIKEFTGGELILAGSNSAAGLRHVSIKYLMLDEIDGYEIDVEGEGDPLSLAESRTDAFGDRKIYKLSTPTLKGISKIEREFEDSDQRYYYIPCPRCKHMQFLKWENINFDYDNKTYKFKGKVAYRCEQCSSLIDEYHKTSMFERGEWRAHNPGHEHRGYHLSSLYSPLGWLSWEKIVREFLKARKAQKAGDLSLIKRWINTRLAETWDEGEEIIGDETLINRCEKYGPDIPEQSAVLTCGVDTQDDRFEIEVVAWGKGEESWGVEHKILYGDPAKQRIWNELDEYLTRTWTHKSGSKMKIACTCIDSGGHHTQQVYKFVRSRQVRRVFATKGSNIHDAPLIARPTLNKALKVKLFNLGTNVAKDYIYSRLRIEEPGPGYMHFSMNYDEEYFEQLTSEKIITTKQGKRIYKKTRPRNEAIDLKVLNFAALAIINPNFDSLIKRISKTKPATEGLIEENKTIKESKTKKNILIPMRRPKKGWVQGWR